MKGRYTVLLGMGRGNGGDTLNQWIDGRGAETGGSPLLVIFAFGMRHYTGVALSRLFGLPKSSNMSNMLILLWLQSEGSKIGNCPNQVGVTPFGMAQWGLLTPPRSITLKIPDDRWVLCT